MYKHEDHIYFVILASPPNNKIDHERRYKIQWKGLALKFMVYTGVVILFATPWIVYPRFSPLGRFRCPLCVLIVVKLTGAFIMHLSDGVRLSQKMSENIRTGG